MRAASQKKPIIEYIRGLAALSVAWFHIAAPNTTGIVAQSAQYGWAGVDAFFIVSGFVIPWSLAIADPSYALGDFPKFMRRRIVRIEIPYLLSVGLVLALAALSSVMPGFRGEAATFDAGQVAAHAFYVVPFTGHSWLQPVYWTLAWEFVFYLTMGLLFVVVGKKEQSLAAYGVAIAILLVVLARLGEARMLLFVAGFCLFRAIRHGETARGLICAGAMTLALPFGGGMWIQAVVACATLAAIFLLWNLEPGGGLVSRALGFLGAVSYSLYLVHVPIGGRVMNLGKRFVSGEIPELALALLALAISLAFAWLFWLFVERPAIRLARSSFGRRRTPQRSPVRNDAPGH